jgi:imidazolonepropionase-like amidohydrolase
MISFRSGFIVTVLATFNFFSPGAFGADLVLKGATVHTVSGETIADGQVLIRADKIEAVGKSVPNEGAQILELAGLHLYPGLICLDTVLGLLEIGGVRATLDHAEVGEYTPEVESWIAVNPDSELISVARANGIAYFEPVPQGGIISGQSALVTVEGWTVDNRTIRKPVALHLFWPSMTLDTSSRERPRAKVKSLEEQAKERRSKLRGVEQFFEEAKAYGKAKAAGARGTAPAPLLVPAWESMLPYVQGNLPIMVHANEVRQIRTAVEWAITNKYKIILAEGRDSWMLADLLATNRIPVIYSHIFTLPSRDTESYDAHFRAPELLRKAGVTVVFSIGPEPFDAPSARNLPYHASQAVAFGFPPAEALKGLTLYPAKILGLEKDLGSLEAGKKATLFATDGDVLDLRSSVKRMWVGGKEISLENKQTRLYQKYKERPRGQ